MPTVPKSSPLWAQSDLKWLYKGTQPLDVLLWRLGVSEPITVGAYTGTPNFFGPSSYSNTSIEAHFLGTHIYFQLGVEKPRPRTLPPPLRSPCKIWLLYFIPCGRIHTGPSGRPLNLPCPGFVFNLVTKPNSAALRRTYCVRELRDKKLAAG